VWTADRSYVSAAFGLARTRLASGDRRGAILALGSVPDSSSYHVAAQTAAVRVLVAAAGGTAEDDLRQAADLLSRIQLDDSARQRLTVEVLKAALDWATGAGNGAGPAGPGRTPLPRQRGTGTILGCELTERSLRFGLEASYRALARLTPDEGSRIQLVDMANAVRPRTWT